MSGFTTDYENTSDYGLIPQGDYEVIIGEMKEKTMKSGAVGMNMKLIIRNDVKQNSQNRYIFHTLWKRKTPTAADMQVQGYGFNQIMYLAKAASIPAGKNYENVYDLCKDLQGRCIKVAVIHEEYNGRTSERIDSMYPSDYPENHHEYRQKKENQSAPVAVPDLSDFEVLSDGDVPF